MASSSSSSSSQLGLVDTLLQRSLDDLIRSLRAASAGDEPAIVARSLAEIRREVRSPDPSIKSTALSKLSYLSSLHFLDISWAAFHALELLPSPSLPHKRIAYLAATVSLSPSSPLLLLSHNQLYKDLSPSSPFPVLSLALHFLSFFPAPDLAPQLHALLASPRTPVCAAAAAAAIRLLLRSPDSLRLSLHRLVEHLSSSAAPAVSVFCELTAADPRPYLPLAPEFYRILVDCRNNWTLIKVLKIFARLAPLEPRLARRIVGPVCEHMRRSYAKSLVFECVLTVAACLGDFDNAVRLAVDRIKEFLASDEDANLRYLGLHALALLGPRHSWAVEESRQVVIKSLSDPDPNIRREALRLIMAMVFDANVVEISVLLVGYAGRSDPEFCNEILGAILSACGRNYYELVIDFDWYVALLGDMARIPHCAKGVEIEEQLVDIGLRVKDARPELVHLARELLIDPALLGSPSLCRILCAAAWVSGEYVEFSRNPLELVEALLQPRTNLLPASVRAVYIQAVFKVFTFCFCTYFERLEAGQASETKESGVGTVELETNGDSTGGESLNDGGGVTAQEPNSLLSSVERAFTHESILYMLNLIETAIAPLSDCGEVEVQERVRSVLGLIQMVQDFRDWKTEEEGLIKDYSVNQIVELLRGAFSEELGPVAASAQRRVPVPDGLILNENLTELMTVFGEEDIVSPVTASFFGRNVHQNEIGEEHTESTESTSLLAEHRKRHGMYYLPVEKDEIKFNDYPPANDPQLPVSNATGDLAKLADHSLFSSKAKPTKPRPVVIKLDEGDVMQNPAPEPMKDLKNDMLSGVVTDILVNEDKLTLRQNRDSKMSSQKERSPSISDESTSHAKENVKLVDIEHGDSSSRSSRSRRHSKERNRSSSKNGDSKEGIHRKSTKSKHHHRKHPHKQQEDVISGVVPQTTVIQDFLL